MKPWTMALILGTFAMAAERTPMEVNFADSASYHWLHKPVIERRVEDNMESLGAWSVFTRSSSGAVLDAREARSGVPAHPQPEKKVLAEMVLTREKSHDGGQSIRLRTPTAMGRPDPVIESGWVSSAITQWLNGEDWRPLNRISLWVYPDCPAHYTISMGVSLRNEGTDGRPEATASAIPRNHQWNWIVSEIGNVARDKITGVTLSGGMLGSEPKTLSTVTFYFDTLELERVELNYAECWGVWPGRISNSHTGYQSGVAKSAIASGATAREFRLIDQGTSETVLSKAVEAVKTRLGGFRLMDFSEIRKTGSCVLETGGTVTRPCRIDPNVWFQTIFKALNCLYGQRRGIAIPGLHGICHRDWQVVQGDKRMIVNAGWHDAGDLAQGISMTGEIDCSEGDRDHWAALIRNAGTSREQARFQDAADLLSEALHLTERMDRPGTLLAQTLMLLGSIRADMGKPREAERAYLKSLAAWERSAPADVARSTVMMGLATVYQAMGEYSKAEHFAWTALRIREQTANVSDSELGGALQNLAAIYYADRRFNEALRLYRQALELMIRNGHRDDVATAHSNLGLLLGKMGQAEESVFETGQAIAIWETGGAREQPRLALGLSNQAAEYCHLGRWRDAEVSIYRAREIAEHAMGADHPSLAPILTIYADVLRHTGRKAEARRMERDAQVLRQAAAAGNLTGYTVEASTLKP